MSDQDWADKAAEQIDTRYNEWEQDFLQKIPIPLAGERRKEIAAIVRSSSPSSALVEAARQLAIEPILSTVDGLVIEWNCKCCAAVLLAEYAPDSSNKIFRVHLTNGPDQMKHKPDCDWMAFRSALSGIKTVCEWKKTEEYPNGLLTDCGRVVSPIHVRNYPAGEPTHCMYCGLPISVKESKNEG